jgi:prophage regulatory protein
MQTPQKLIPLKAAADRVGKSRWWLRQEWLAGRFPKPVIVGHRSTMFLESEIDSWITAKIAERDAA